MTEVKPLSDEEVTEAIRDKGGAFPFAKWSLATITALKSENENLRELLRDVTDALDTYGPDFVHGEPKKIVVKRARAALAKG